MNKLQNERQAVVSTLAGNQVVKFTNVKFESVVRKDQISMKVRITVKKKQYSMPHQPAYFNQEIDAGKTKKAMKAIKKAIKEQMCEDDKEKCGKKIGFKKNVISCDISITKNAVKLTNGCNFYFSPKENVNFIKQKQIVQALCQNKKVQASTVSDHCKDYFRLPADATANNVARNSISGNISSIVLSSLTSLDEKKIFTKFKKRMGKLLAKKVFQDKKKIYLVKKLKISKKPNNIQLVFNLKPVYKILKAQLKIYQRYEKSKTVVLTCNLQQKNKLRSNCRLSMNKRTFKQSTLDSSKVQKICKIKADTLEKNLDVSKMYIDCLKGKMTKGKGFKSKKKKQIKKEESDTEIMSDKEGEDV